MKIYSHAIHSRCTINWRHCLVSLLTSNNKTGLYKVPLMLSMHDCFLISRRSFIIISSIIGMLTFYWCIKLLPMKICMKTISRMRTGNIPLILS